MIIECPECIEQRNIPEPLPPHQQYRCRLCGTELIFIREDNEPADSKEKARWQPNRTILPKIFLAALILLVMISAGGSPAILAKQEGNLTGSLTDIYQSFIGLSPEETTSMNDIREIVARYEGGIVSEALQAMRLSEDLLIVPQVKYPTNDMALFPSPDYPLFPDYLSSRFSQFFYTVDKKGDISIDTSMATTTVPLDNIEQLLLSASR